MSNICGHNLSAVSFGCCTVANPIEGIELYENNFKEVYGNNLEDFLPLVKDDSTISVSMTPIFERRRFDKYNYDILIETRLHKASFKILLKLKSNTMPYKKSIGTKTTVSAKKVKASVKPIKKAVKTVVKGKKK